MALSVTGIKNAKAKEKPYRLSDEKNLYLLVMPTGSKLWRFDYRFGGKRNTLAFGKWNDVELFDLAGIRIGYSEGLIMRAARVGHAHALQDEAAGRGEQLTNIEACRQACLEAGVPF